MMRLQLMLMSAKLKIVRLQFRNGAIWALIALFLANQIAPIVHDFKMNIIKLYINTENVLHFLIVQYFPLCISLFKK